MLGAIVGDIAGDVYEFSPVKSKNIELITPDSSFTDDTVMTLAVAEWLRADSEHSSEMLIKIMRRFGRFDIQVGYGGLFYDWLLSPHPRPYGSFGNGSGMRVSPIGMYAHSLEETLDLAKRSAEVTHNHPEGIKGAQAIAAATYLWRTGSSKDEIKAYVEQSFGYNLHRALDEIRPDYDFDPTCQGSVGESIICFLEGTDFEDVIRNAISLGGDSDTMAAMAGGIAAARDEGPWKIPEHLAIVCCNRLDPFFQEVLDNFESFLQNNQSNK